MYLCPSGRPSGKIPDKALLHFFQVILLDIRRQLGRWRQGIFLAAQPRIETIQAGIMYHPANRQTTRTAKMLQLARDLAVASRGAGNGKAAVVTDSRRIAEANYFSTLMRCATSNFCSPERIWAIRSHFPGKGKRSVAA